MRFVGRERNVSPLAEQILAVCKAHDIHPSNLTRNAFRRLHQGRITGTKTTLWSEATAEASQSIGDTAGIPMPAIPPGFAVQKVSTMVRTEDGKPQWIKADRERESRAAAIERIAAMLNGLVKPRDWQIPAPEEDLPNDLLSVIVFGDPHIGMYAVAAEAGQHWDIKRGTDIHKRAIEALVLEGVTTSKCVILVLGDTTHSDSMRNATTKGTPVDVDGSHIDCMLAAYETLVYATDIALAVHDSVELVNLAGNHDKETAFAISQMLAIHYRDEPRVTVPIVRGPAWHTLFGETLIAATHGDTLRSEKPEGLMLTMANDWAPEWGRATWRFWLCGHVHHWKEQRTKEVPGGVVRTFRTLVPQDRYHAHAGYRAKQDARKIVFHKTAGQRHDHSVTAEFLAVPR